MDAHVRPFETTYVDDLLATASGATATPEKAARLAPFAPETSSDSQSEAKAASAQQLTSPLRRATMFLRNAVGAGDKRVRSASKIRVLEDDIVAQNYQRLQPIELVESGADLPDKPPPGDTQPWSALAIASSPLFDTSIDAEKLTDNSGILVKKNASYAKAYFLGGGFLSAFVKSMKNNVTAVSWFPQPTSTKFLNYSYMAPTDFAAYGSGACALLNTDPKNPLECIMMTGHQGGVSSYGLCRNGSEFLAMHYIAGLVTPADVGGLVSAGTWIENMRDVLFTGLEQAPICVGKDKLVVQPKLNDWRLLSGPFSAAVRGPTTQWLDMMSLPVPVRARQFYLVGKSGGRLGLTLPNVRRQSFDDIISQITYSATLADTLEIQTPYQGSKYAFITLYRMAGVQVTLPRLQFTFAVAVQSLGLLVFLVVLALRNGPVVSYHIVVQILRLPTFCIISIQLLYVLYYQIFSTSYASNNDTIADIFRKKVVYMAGVSFILMHQLDVRAAVTLWPRMANNDSYYVARLAWMLGSLGVFMWSVNVRHPEHYVVATKPDCALGASECNTSKIFFMQHWICLGIFVGHPIAYAVIQIVQWYRNRSEYSPRDQRHPDYVTSFEAYGCGGPLTYYYYYHTLVTKKIVGRDTADGDVRTLQYLTCAKAVRDEGFVLLEGCDVLIRAKDLYVIMLMKMMPRQAAATINLSVVLAHIQDLRLTPMRRVSYETLWLVAQRWNGKVSYPDIG